MPKTRFTHEDIDAMFEAALPPLRNEQTLPLAQRMKEMIGRRNAAPLMLRTPKKG